MSDKLLIKENKLSKRIPSIVYNVYKSLSLYLTLTLRTG